jgi:hypothetical protein
MDRSSHITDDLSQAKIPGRKQTLGRQSDLLKRQVNKLIEELYGIREGDMQLIEDWQKSNKNVNLSEKELSS